MDDPKDKKWICDEKNTDAGCSQIPNIICSNKKALLSKVSKLPKR